MYEKEMILLSTWYGRVRNTTTPLKKNNESDI